LLLAWVDSWLFARTGYHESESSRVSIGHLAGRVSLIWDDMYGRIGTYQTGFRVDSMRLTEHPLFNWKKIYGYRRTDRFPNLSYPWSHILPPFDWHNRRSVWSTWQVATKGVDIPYWLLLCVVWAKPVAQLIRQCNAEPTAEHDSATAQQSLSVPSVYSVVPDRWRSSTPSS
jgi:hypothetical protein